jgi:hypothetical protein
MLELLVPVITAIIGVGGTLLAIWYRKKVNSDNMECPVGKCVMEDEEILSKLDDMMKDVGADRVSIFSFHNGGEYYSGKSMQKMSMSYEIVSNGISRVQAERQNIPVSSSINTLKPLMMNREMHYKSLNDYPESIYKVYLLSSGCMSVYQWAIFDLQKRAIGILRVDFVKKERQLSDDKLEQLKVAAIKLPGYLCN